MYRDRPPVRTWAQKFRDSFDGVREGTRGINQKFIIGAVQAFPDYSLNDLFYIAGRDQGGHTSPRSDVGDIEIVGRR